MIWGCMAIEWADTERCQGGGAAIKIRKFDMTTVDNEGARDTQCPTLIVKFMQGLCAATLQDDLRAGLQGAIGPRHIGIAQCCLEKGIKIGMSSLGNCLAIGHGDVAAQDGIEPKIISRAGSVGLAGKGGERVGLHHCSRSFLAVI